MNFNCPYCGQNLDVDDDSVEQSGECPACGNKIQIPALVPRRQQENYTKLCPYCSEPIQASAVKCKHCGSFLNSPITQQMPNEPYPIARRNHGYHQPFPPERPTGQGTAHTLAVLSLVLGILSFFMFALFFGPAAIVTGVIGGSKGKGLGWAGMVLGILGSFLWVLFLLSGGDL